MKLSELFKTHTEEIISSVIEQLPNALRGDRVNRTFFVKEQDGEIIVDYFVYMGQVSLTDNCFLTIRDYESFDPEDFNVNDFSEIDFRALGWDDKIREEIEQKIETLENEEN